MIVVCCSLFVVRCSLFVIRSSFFFFSLSFFLLSSFFFQDGKMMLYIHSVHLEKQMPKESLAGSMFSFFTGPADPVDNVDPVTVEATLHRGAITEADKAASIGREQVLYTELSETGGSDPEWTEAKSRTLLAFNFINENSEPDDNKDAFVFKVLGQTGKVLGQVSMSAAALFGYSPAADKTTRGVTMTLPLHMEFNGQDSTGQLKEACKLKKHRLETQHSNCASYHEWIPDSEALKWQCDNVDKHWLNEVELATSIEDEGKTTKLAPGTTCGATTKCVKMYTDETKQKFGTITFNVQVLAPETAGVEEKP